MGTSEALALKKFLVKLSSKQLEATHGATSGLDNENSCLSSQHTPATIDVVAPQGCPISDVQQSPNKALRAAVMKSRFAETILKAQKTLLDHGKANHLKMQQKKKRFKSIQHKEISKIKAQMKKAEVDEVETKLKQLRRRETEREAFRVALQKMKKTVDLEDNLWAQKEFDMLIRSSCSYDWPHEVH